MFDVEAIENERLRARVKKLEEDLEKIRGIMTAFTEAAVGVVSHCRCTDDFSDSEFMRMANSSAQLYTWDDGGKK